MTFQVVFPTVPKGGRYPPVFTPEQMRHRKLFFNRMAKRKFVHGNWRQVWVDCGGQCVRKAEDGYPCGNTEYLEFHEPFGEDGSANGWGRLQSRVLLCFTCHCKEHPTLSGEPQRKTGNTLNDDVQLEIWMCGGWDNWIKKFKLQDTFGRLLNV